MRQRGEPLSGYDLNEVGLRVGSASLPGRSLSTHEHRTTGLFRKMPYHMQYNELTLEFILSRSMYERTLIEAWQDIVYNNGSNDINYYNNIVGTIIIRQLAEDDAITKVIKIMEVFPNTLNDIEVAYDTNDSYAKQSVTFNFHHWEIDGSRGVTFPLILTPPEIKSYIQQLNDYSSVGKEFVDIIDINAERGQGFAP